MDHTYVLSTEHNIYPNITIEERYNNGEFAGYSFTANEGYVFYDTLENKTEIDPETMMEVPVIYYYTLALKPRNYNWNNFHYVAVPRDSVDENYVI